MEKEEILTALKRVEDEKKVKILWAAEAGSRAWGFASPDSDYDVRFVYVRPAEDYMTLYEPRDVIEYPINDELDLSGWDLRKALCLGYKGNAALLEWLNSPIVYLRTDLMEEASKFFRENFRKTGCLAHYTELAKHNYHTCLCRDEVLPKEYLYVLRAIWAGQWISQYNSAPSVVFTELMDKMANESTKTTAKELLRLKMKTVEKISIPRDNKLNEYLLQNIEELKKKIAESTYIAKGDVTELDAILKKALLEYDDITAETTKKPDIELQ